MEPELIAGLLDLAEDKIAEFRRKPMRNPFGNIWKTMFLYGT